MEGKNEVRRVLLVTLALNLLVSAAKVFYGYVSGSVAILSDGYHSLFDGVSNVVGLTAVYIACHPPDEHHPYGHRKYETVFTIFVGLLMLLTCFEIFKDVYRSLLGSSRPHIGAGSFAVMLGTMAVNVFVAVYEKKMGGRLRSEFLIADSRHTLSDIYVTVGVIVSLVFMKLGFTHADPIAGVVVGILVARAGLMIILESTEVLVDRAQTDHSTIVAIATGVSGVRECHKIRARGPKSSVFIDLHVLVDPALSIGEAHGIAHEVEERIKKALPEVVDVVVHLEPLAPGKTYLSS